MTEQPVQMRIFVSYCSADRTTSDQLVVALRGAGADVWYDEHSAVAGQAREEIKRELQERTVFVVVVSKAALASDWLQDECQWAFHNSQSRPEMVFLPVVAGAFASADLYGALYLGSMKRVEASKYQPYHVADMIRRTLTLLTLTPQGETPIAITPQTGRPFEELLIQGKALAARKMYREALPFFKQATQVAPHSFGAWLALGYALNQLERWAEALRAIEHALAIHAESAVAWVNKSQALVGMKRSLQGLEAAERALTLGRRNTAWFGPDLVMLNIPFSEEASPVERPPTTASAWYTRGYDFLMARSYAAALEAFDQALALEPTDAGAWTNKGLALAGLNRNSEALVAHDQALALNPALPQAWYNKGHSLFDLKRFDDALVAYDHAIALEPSNADAWTFRGMTLNALGRWEEALAEFNRAVAVAPGDADAWRGKAEALGRLGREAEAEMADQRARKLGR